MFRNFTKWISRLSDFFHNLSHSDKVTSLFFFSTSEKSIFDCNKTAVTWIFYRGAFTTGELKIYSCFKVLIAILIGSFFQNCFYIPHMRTVRKLGATSMDYGSPPQKVNLRRILMLVWVFPKSYWSLNDIWLSFVFGQSRIWGIVRAVWIKPDAWAENCRV